MNNIDPSKYVVLDVETNGLTVAGDDLLSISFYMPDKDKKYERFLPLELNRFINPEASKINGITIEMIQNQKPLTQEEYDLIKDEFELEQREILHFGRIDQTFIKNYFQRHKIKGFEKLVFHNIKRHFLTNSFSSGEYSKDNLCKGMGIEGVTKVHSGLNDCILEWKLFEKTEGGFILCLKMGNYEIGMFKLTPDYYIPASRIRYFPNMKYAIDLPKMRVDYQEVFRLELSKNCRHKKDIWFQPAGFASERILRAMLNAKLMDDNTFAKENFKKLQFVGKFTYESEEYEIPVTENEDGTLSAVRIEDKAYVEETNRVMLSIKQELPPLVEFIKKEIFKSKQILTQELVVSDELKAFGYTDFSNEEACLEMKFSDSLMNDYSMRYHPSLNKHKYQMYILSNKRPSYILIGGYNEFVIAKIVFFVGKESIKERISSTRVYKTRTVLQYTSDGDFVRQFNSAKEAADSLGVKVKSIRENCTGRYKLVKGFQFKYENSDKTIEKVEFLPRTYHRGNAQGGTRLTKHVLQYDLDGNFIREFESAKIAQQETGAPASKISMVCNGLRKHSMGFIWKYKKE